MEPKLATQDPARDDTDPIAVAPAEGSEATVLHRVAPSEPLQPARLVVLAGPRTGLEVPITEQEVSIGRGPENLLVLPDISVSRRHAMLRREEGRYVLLDQASGNGTRLNGKPVARSPLRSGDRIALGDSLVQFFDPEEGTAKSAAAEVRTNPGIPRERLSRRSIYYLGAGALLVVFFALAGWRKHQRDVAERLAVQQVVETRALAAERFAEAKKLLGEGRWSDALGKLRIAAELNPRDREIGRYLKKADDEAPHAAALGEARAALGRKDFAAAQTALSQVPEDSVLAESARDLRAAIGQAMDEAVREARTKAEENDAAAAAARLAPVLAADPARADAIAIREALSRTTARKAPRQKAARAPSTSTAPPGAIERAYLAGDLAAAIELAERNKNAPKAARSLRDLRGFEAAYREGFAHLQAGKVPEAATALDRASGFDRKIAGRATSPLGARVRKALSSLHTEMALELTEAAELPRAAAQLRAAVSEDPANERAQKELQLAMGRAHEEYMRGYVAKDSDPDLARASFRIAAETLPPSDDEGQKARRWLEKLSGGSAPREAE